MKDFLKNPRKLLITSGALALVLLIILILFAFIFFRFNLGKMFKDHNSKFLTNREISEIKSDAKEAEKDALLNDISHQLSSGAGANAMIRNLFPDKLVYSIGGTYYFKDIDDSLKKNTLDNSKFSTSNDGIVSYSGMEKTYAGIDVSSYQYNVDYSAVKKSGIDYVMIRCGYRGSENGQLVTDSYFEKNISSALKNDLEVGVYFFSQAITKEEAREEADYTINLIKNYSVDYPVAIDIESVSDACRQSKVSPEELTEIVITFCERIKEAGYTPMIYSNLPGFCSLVEIEKLDAYDKWFANYAAVPYFAYEFTMWQYTSNGSVDGISGNVDLNICFKKYE